MTLEGKLWYLEMYMLFYFIQGFLPCSSDEFKKIENKSKESNAQNNFKFVSRFFQHISNHFDLIVKFIKDVNSFLYQCINSLSNFPYYLSGLLKKNYWLLLFLKDIDKFFESANGKKIINLVNEQTPPRFLKNIRDEMCTYIVREHVENNKCMVFKDFLRITKEIIKRFPTEKAVSFFFIKYIFLIF